MKIAFKKTLPTDGILTKLVGWEWGTKGNYHHSELIFSDGVSISAGRIINGKDDNDVSFKTLDFSDTNRWDIIYIDFLDLNEAKMREVAELLIGAKYDWKGIFLTFVFPFALQNKSRWMCSEIAVELLKQGGAGEFVGISSNTMSPNKLYTFLMNLKKN